MVQPGHEDGMRCGNCGRWIRRMWVNVWAEIFQLCNQNGLSMGDGGFSMGWRMNAYVDVVTNAGGIGPLLIM